MNVEIREIQVDSDTMTSEINIKDNRKVYIIQDGRVFELPLPAFGILEIPCQNFKVGNPSYRITTKLR